jgi:ferredoxin
MTTTATFNFDATLARLRERAEDAGYDIGDGYCQNCGGKITEADLEEGACSQCFSQIESDDEDLNGWELGNDD